MPSVSSVVAYTRPPSELARPSAFRRWDGSSEGVLPSIISFVAHTRPTFPSSAYSAPVSSSPPFPRCCHLCSFASSSSPSSSPCCSHSHRLPSWPITLSCCRHPLLALAHNTRPQHLYTHATLACIIIPANALGRVTPPWHHRIVITRLSLLRQPLCPMLLEHRPGNPQ